MLIVYVTVVVVLSIVGCLYARYIYTHYVDKAMIPMSADNGTLLKLRVPPPLLKWMRDVCLFACR